MTIERKRSNKRGRRKMKTLQRKPLELLGDFFKEKDLSPSVEKDVDKIVAKFWKVPSSRRRLLTTYIRMKMRQLEKAEPKEREEGMKVLKDIMSKTMRFEADESKSKFRLVRQEQPKDYVEPSEEPDVVRSIATLPKVKTPEGPSVVHAMDAKTYLTEKQQKEIDRAVYPDERIYWKYLKRLSVKEKDKLRLLLQRRGLDKYLKVPKDKVKKEIDAAFDAKKYAEKSHKTEELFTLHKLLLLKTKYLADSHTEKEWLKLWGPAYDEHRASINMDLINMDEWRERYGHLLRK